MRRRYTETDKKLMTDIGENLKKVLKQKGYQQKDLSELTGLSTSAVSDYANGKALMNPGTVQIIADALKVSKADIDPTFRGTLDNKIPESSVPERDFVDSLELSDEEMLQNFTPELDGQPISREEYLGMIAYIRAKRQVKSSDSES